MPARTKHRKRSRRERRAPDTAKELHPIWSGTISFGLVSVPVDLFSAIRSGGVPLRMLTEDGVPLRRRYFCPQDGKELSSDELVHGYEAEDGVMVPLTDEELEAVEPRKSRDIDLRRFVAVSEIDPFRYERTYVLTPSGESTKAYRLLADVMEREQKAGIATFVMRSKEYLVAILARAGILWAETMRFAGGLRSPQEVGLPDAAKPARSAVEQFARAIRDLRKPAIDEDELHDPRAARLRELVGAKQRAGDILEVPELLAADEGDVDAEDMEHADPIETIRLRLAGKRVQRARASEARNRSRALQTLSKSELYERAKEQDVPGRSQMTKEELVAALRARA